MTAMQVHEWRDDEADARQRGVAFGTWAAARLHVALDEYLARFAAFGVPDALSHEIAQRSLEVVAGHRPQLAEEVVGTAIGAGLAPWQVMALNARTEIMALLQPVGPGECSTAVHLPLDGAAPRTVQTWDWHDTLSNDTVLRAFPGPDGTRIATFSEFGQLAKIGVSTRGLGIHFNILHHGSDGSRVGVPVHVLARVILEEASTVDEAVEIARALEVGASTVLTVVSRGREDDRPRAASIEVSPVGVAVLEAVPGRTLAHTNHFLAQELAAGETAAYRSSTRERYEFLLEHGRLAAIVDDVQRAAAFGSVHGSPMCLRPNPADPEHLRWETKLTVTLDVDHASLGYEAASPAEVSSAAWRRWAA